MTTNSSQPSAVRALLPGHACRRHAAPGRVPRPHRRSARTHYCAAPTRANDSTGDSCAKPAAVAAPTTAPAAPAPAPTAAPAAAPAEPSGLAAQVTISAANDIESADPHTNQALIYNNVIRMNVFNALVRYRPEPRLCAGSGRKVGEPGR